MCRHLRSIAVASLLCLTVLIAVPVAAGDWSAAQQEVWKNVDAYWAVLAKDDVDGFLGYMHDDYSGWSLDSPVPESKATSAKYLRFFVPRRTLEFYEITPLAIVIHGDVAVVHYYYMEVAKNSEGKVRTEHGRWTDILVKQGDRWVLFADHGGATEDEG
jgi:ketosteroid isomerase-like protein